MSVRYGALPRVETRVSALGGAAGLGTEADDDELGLGGFALAEFAAADDGAGRVGKLGLLIHGGVATNWFSVHGISLKHRPGQVSPNVGQNGAVRRFCAQILRRFI